MSVIVVMPANLLACQLVDLYDDLPGCIIRWSLAFYSSVTSLS